MGVCESIVTCARTRGSGMMVLPVAAATASMTWPISASLKLGVMRWPLLCALTMPVAVKARSAASTPARKVDSLIAFNTMLLFVPRRRLLRRLFGRNHAIAAIVQLFRFVGDLREVQHDFLLAAVAHDADAGVGGGAERGEDLLRPVLVVEWRAVGGRHQVASAQPDTGEGLAVGAGINAEAAHLAAGEHGLRTHDLADDRRVVGYHAAHAFERGVATPSRIRGWRGSRGGESTVGLAGQHHRLQRAATVDDGA